jgi:hypothetical protein
MVLCAPPPHCDCHARNQYRPRDCTACYCRARNHCGVGMTRVLRWANVAVASMLVVSPLWFDYARHRSGRGGVVESEKQGSVELRWWLARRVLLRCGR